MRGWEGGFIYHTKHIGNVHHAKSNQISWSFWVEEVGSPYSRPAEASNVWNIGKKSISESIVAMYCPCCRFGRSMSVTDCTGTCGCGRGCGGAVGEGSARDMSESVPSHANKEARMELKWVGCQN